MGNTTYSRDARALTYQDIKATGVFTIDRVIEFRMGAPIGEHATAYISGTIVEDVNVLELEKQLKCKTMSIFAGDEHTPLFAGIILDADIKKENDYHFVEIWLKSGTYLLDMTKKSRSHQKIDDTYKDVVKRTLEDTPDSDFIMTVGYDVEIEIPLIQFLETHYEFIERLATHHGTHIFPELTTAKPKFWFGMRNSTDEVVFDDFEYTAGVSEKFYENGGELAGLDRKDFYYYKVKSFGNYQIGDKAVFKRKNLVICEKKCYFNEGGLLRFEYTLALPTYQTMRQKFNEKICGMSLLGTVLETDREVLKVHLDIDEYQDVATAYPYDWVPTTNNLVYLMPEVGTRVSLYFYSSDERSARVVNNVRTNGGEQHHELQDYNNRYLTTEHKKRYYYFPTMMGLVGTSDTETPLHILIDDENGVTFQSHKEFKILAKEGISIQAKTCAFQCITELLLSHAELSVEEGSL